MDAYAGNRIETDHPSDIEPVQRYNKSVYNLTLNINAPSIMDVLNDATDEQLQLHLLATDVDKQFAILKEVVQSYKINNRSMVSTDIGSYDGAQNNCVHWNKWIVEKAGQVWPSRFRWINLGSGTGGVLDFTGISRIIKYGSAGIYYGKEGVYYGIQGIRKGVEGAAFGIGYVPGVIIQEGPRVVKLAKSAIEYMHEHHVVFPDENDPFYLNIEHGRMMPGSYGGDYGSEPSPPMGLQFKW